MQYFLFITFFSFFAFLQNAYNKNKNINLLIFYFFIFFIALVLGLRGNEDEYTRLYSIFPSLGNFFEAENSKYLHQKGFLFAFIVAILKSFELSSQSLFILFCFLSVFLNAIYIRKFTDFYYLAFLFYISHGLVFKEWSGLRMGLASAMLLPMIYYLNQGKKIHFFLLAASATLIQYISVLSLSLIFLNKSFSRKILLLGLIFALVLYKTGISHFIVDFFLSKNLLPQYVSSYFLIDNPYIYDAGLTHYKLIQQLILVVLLIVFFGNNQINFNKFYNLLFNTYYLGTCLMIVFSNYALLAFRINGFFYSVEPILITFLILPFKQKKFISNMLILISLTIAYINYVIFSKVSPYIFLIENAKQIS